MRADYAGNRLSFLGLLTSSAEEDEAMTRCAILIPAPATLTFIDTFHLIAGGF
jgi:hypothetical protein